MTIWSEENDKDLKRYIEEGYSATKIGEFMGFTRNAVLGRCYRLRQKNYLESLSLEESAELRKKHAQKVKDYKDQMRVKNPKPMKISLQVTAPVMTQVTPTKTKGVPFVKVTNKHCRWPLWAADTPLSQKLCCGAHPTAGVYCEAHSNEAHNHR